MLMNIYSLWKRGNMKKHLWLMDFIVGSRINPNNNTKQGNFKFDDLDIYKMFSLNSDLVTELKEKYGYVLQFDEIKLLLEEFSYSENINPIKRYDALFVEEKGKYKLNKTPTPIIRNAYVKYLFNNKFLDSNDSKKAIKKVLLEDEFLRPADTYRYTNTDKDPVDQIITNLVSSNWTNHLNQLLFHREKIEGKKNQYTYSLTQEGLKYATKLIHSNDSSKKEDRQSRENKEIILEDKMKRESKLKIKAIEAVRNGTIPSCELSEKHFTFKKENGDIYFEGHHVIPNSKSSIKDKVDTERWGNYIAVCPLCHMALHHAQERVFIEKIHEVVSIYRVYKYMSEHFGIKSKEEAVIKLKHFYKR